MSLIKTGSGIVEIKGQLGGVYFHRDSSGLHENPKPRHIKKRTASQKAQRDAFAQARRFCNIQACISYNIYRVLNGLSLKHYHPA